MTQIFIKSTIKMFICDEMSNCKIGGKHSTAQWDGWNDKNGTGLSIDNTQLAVGGV